MRSSGVGITSSRPTGYLRFIPLLSTLLAAGSGCIPSEIPQSAESPRFVNVSQSAGVSLTVVSGTAEKDHILGANTGGCALFDYDNDGDLDIFFVNGRQRVLPAGTGPTAALYRNDRDWSFVDVTQSAGLSVRSWGMGVTAVDSDGDGWLDLYLTGYGANSLYINNRDGTFSERAARRGVDYEDWSSGSAFADFDGDGDLDFYLSNYLRLGSPEPGVVEELAQQTCTWRSLEVFCGPQGLPAAVDGYYESGGESGGWRFLERGREVGLSSYEYYGMGVIAVDYDDDGDEDVWVANDSTPNLLYSNDGGRFTDVAEDIGLAYSGDGRRQAGMGLAAGDYDGDGDTDLFVTNFSHDYNTLYANEGGRFVDVSFAAGLAREGMSSLGWGTGFFDYDNDGDSDLFVANGHVYPQVDGADLGTSYRQSNQLFSNSGEGFFQDVSNLADLAAVESSRGAAFGDLDNDGDVDMAIVNLDGVPALFRNDGGNRRNWISIELKDADANSRAIGAAVWLSAGESRQRRAVRSGTGYLSQDDTRLHFGLGEEWFVNVEVRWPDGGRTTHRDLPANVFVEIDRDGHVAVVGSP